VKNKAGWICFLGALLVSSGALYGQGAGQPRILKVSGDGQLVQYLWSFTQPLVVRVVDGSGLPIAGRQVTWSDLGGISYASDKVTSTDADGFALLQWVPGGNFGIGVPYLSYTITATTDVGSVSFSAVAYPFQSGSFNPQPSVQFTKPGQGAPPIEGRVGDRLVDAVQVAVVTTGGPGVSPGLPIPGVGLTVTSVNQNPAQGPVAICEGGTPLTNSNGIASCDLLVSGSVGTTQLVLNVGDMVAQMAHLTVVPGISSSVAIVQGNNQSGVPGQTLGSPLVARIVNASGQAMPGVAANWTVVTPGSLSLVNIVAVSDAAGLVSANVQLGMTPGTYQVRVASGPGEATFNVSVLSGVPAQLTITTASLPNGAVGTVYNRSLAVAGGTPPYTWSLAAGLLPAELTLSPAGVISGTPQAVGAYNITVRVTDGTGAIATRALSLAIGSGVIITTTSLPTAAPGVPYSHQLLATGGTPPYTWRHDPGTFAVRPLPPGLQLTTAGVLTGTPTQEGSWPFTVEARDSVGVVASQTLTLTAQVGGGGGGGIGGAGLSITTTSLPVATAQGAYAQTLTATGGTPPYNWGIAAGNLPQGLTLTPTGVLSGIPIIAGSYGFTAQVTDGVGTVVVRNLNLEVTVSSALSITTAAALPNGVVNISYLQQLNATGGQAPYTWTLMAGSLPAGILISTSGLLSGTPQVAATSVFTMLVRDATGATATREFTLVIGTGITVTSPAALPPGVVGLPYSYTLTATGGTGQYSWTLFSGALPQGLSLAPQGAIIGTPSVASTGVFVVRVNDSSGLFRLETFNIEVTSELVLPRSGVVAQLAAGGGWNTGLSLVNAGTAGASVQVQFVSQTGAALSLPVTVTQGGTGVTQVLDMVETTVPANGTVLIETIDNSAATTVGWAEVRSSSPVSGFAIFRQTSPEGRVSEGTSPVEARAPRAVLAQFDNTGGFVTGVALVNLSGSDATITVIQRNDAGQEIARDTWTLVARGHTSFAVSVQYPGLAGRRGTLEFQSDRLEGVMALGLRFSPAATFTSIPVVVRP
jgi:hypothetical protein